MAKPDKSVEIINPPNMLKAKVGGKLPPADQAAIERAEMALGQIKHQFQDWLAEEVTKMEALIDSVSQVSDHLAHFRLARQTDRDQGAPVDRASGSGSRSCQLDPRRADPEYPL